MRRDRALIWRLRGIGDPAMKWRNPGVVGLRAMVMGALALLPAVVPASAEVDLFLAARAEQEMARGNPASGFAMLEDAVRSPDTTPEEKVALLRELAQLRLRFGNFADAGEAIALQADLTARLEGATAPELASLYAAASDAYASANDLAKALSLAEDALRIDSQYFECDAEMIARDHLRIAELLAKLGETAKADEARRLGADRWLSPTHRCRRETASPSRDSARTAASPPPPPETGT